MGGGEYRYIIDGYNYIFGLNSSSFSSNEHYPVPVCRIRLFAVDVLNPSPPPVIYPTDSNDIHLIHNDYDINLLKFL